MTQPQPLALAPIPIPPTLSLPNPDFNQGHELFLQMQANTGQAIQDLCKLPRHQMFAQIKYFQYWAENGGPQTTAERNLCEIYQKRLKDRYKLKKEKEQWDRFFRDLDIELGLGKLFLLVYALAIILIKISEKLCLFLICFAIIGLILLFQFGKYQKKRRQKQKQYGDEDGEMLQ